MHIEHIILQARLKNCLLTIVELEPALSRLNIHSELLNEFKQLKDIISKISQLDISLEEVTRIENATRLLLDELDIPLSFLRLNRDCVLQ
jgi:Trp operon repressor